MPKRINPRNRHRRINRYKLKVEREYAKELRAYFKQQIEYIEGALTGKKGFKEQLIIDILGFANEDWEVQLTLLQVLVDRYGERVAEKAAQDAIKELDLEIEWNNRHPLYLQWIEEFSAREVTNIDSTTRRTIKQIISDGVDEGLGRDQIAKKLRDEYASFSPRRSKMIANNEVAEAYANGNFIMYQRANVNYKRWWTTNDAKVSQGCQDNQDQGIINMQEPFKSGHMVPPRHPNCRCDILPEFEREKSLYFD